MSTGSTVTGITVNGNHIIGKFLFLHFFVDVGVSTFGENNCTKIVTVKMSLSRLRTREKRVGGV